MTNGEKLQSIFPNMRIDVFESYVQVVGENYEFNNLYPLEWWNAEYIEPTIKNGLGVEKIIDELEKEFEKVNIPIMDKLTLFAKTQNALYRCADMRKGGEMSKWIAEFELEDGDTMPEHMDLNYKGARIDFHCKPLEQPSTTKNDLSSGTRKNSEKLEKETTKNDLAVDCISRQAVIEEMEKRHADGDYITKGFINKLPQVTPIRPKGHWICDGKGRSFADYHCSECGLKLALCGQDIKQRQDSGYSLFCGGCGADMREVVEE